MIGVFTFGCGQQCTCGRPLNNHFTELQCDDLQHGRERMFTLWGSRWSMAYASREDAGVERFGLKKITTVTELACAPCPCGNLVEALVYRDAPPDAPGFWWLLDDAGVEQVVEVVELAKRTPPFGHMQETDELVAFFPGEGHGWRRIVDCRAVGWAGPLPKARRPT